MASIGMPRIAEHEVDPADGVASGLRTELGTDQGHGDRLDGGAPERAHQTEEEQGKVAGGQPHADGADRDREPTKTDGAGVAVQVRERSDHQPQRSREQDTGRRHLAEERDAYVEIGSDERQQRAEGEVVQKTGEADDDERADEPVLSAHAKLRFSAQLGQLGFGALQPEVHTHLPVEITGHAENLGNANHLSCSTPLRLVTPARPASRARPR
jgi:hypothetical protein